MSFWNKSKEFFGFVEENDKRPTESGDPFQQVKMSKPAIEPQKSLKPATQIKFIEPRIYEDSLGIASDLRENKPVIVSLRYLDAQTGKRLIDFICGTAYAINGHMMKIAENIFLFTPSSVQIVEVEEKTPFEQGVEADERQLFFQKADLNK